MMHVSAKGQAFIKREEGLVLHAYNDQVKVPTIGFGHRITSLDRNSGRFRNGITIEQAELLFTADLQHVERLIAAHVTVPLTQNQGDALASLIYNEGVNPILTSDPSQGTLGRKLNAFDYDGAAKQFLVWVKAWDDEKKMLVTLPVLVMRRAREVKLWCTPDVTPPTI